MRIFILFWIGEMFCLFLLLMVGCFVWVNLFVFMLKSLKLKKEIFVEFYGVIGILI